MSEVYESPDGLFRVDFSCFEMRMSHWVCNPRVTHVPTGTVLLDLLGTLWDGSADQETPGRLSLALREYPGSGPGYSLLFDADARTTTRVEGEALETTPW